MKYNLLMSLLLVTATSQVFATADESLNGYRNQGAGPFNPMAGRQLWLKANRPVPDTDDRRCSDCHGKNLNLPGKHIRTGKVIDPMNPAIAPERLTNSKKIEKWFKRNCKWTFGRECTPQEKGDLILFIRNQNG
ncbi:DUF1924 domain-containing protein [Sedimenticola sp.]|uniref:DUF1924 domain-containing protein n=1 Tax=Sedimenticola sp. TaxID=1940285 RepID=UPI003D0B1DAC